MFDVQEILTNLAIVMELCEGNVSQLLKQQSGRPLAVSDIHQILRHMTYALIELNSFNIIHRDIKPANILFCHDRFGQFQYKLTDFGVSRVLTDGCLASTLTGSLGYYAPEALKEKKYDARCDVWSLGMVLLECATGKYPFGKPKEYAQLCLNNGFQKIVEQSLVLIPISLSPILVKMLMVNKRTMTILILGRR